MSHDCPSKDETSRACGLLRSHSTSWTSTSMRWAWAVSCCAWTLVMQNLSVPFSSSLQHEVKLNFRLKICQYSAEGHIPFKLLDRISPLNGCEVLDRILSTPITRNSFWGDRKRNFQEKSSPSCLVSLGMIPPLITTKNPQITNWCHDLTSVTPENSWGIESATLEGPMVS